MGYIYLINCNITNKKYYGSTKKSLKHRLQEHESHYRRFKKSKIYYQSSCDILQNNNYNISLMEDCGDIDKKQLKDRERYYIENNECVNIKTPNKTYKEWRDDNTDYNSIHYKKNKEYYDNKNKEWYEKNKSSKQEYNKELDKYKNTWCGNYKTNTNNNLLRIDINIFNTS